MDDIATVFANLAMFVNEDDDGAPLATAALALARVIVTDIRRIADAQEAVVNIYKNNAEAYQKALNK